MAATPAPPGAPPKPTWDPRKIDAPFPWLRPTIRIRLTLLYGGMFLIAGILLLSIIYLLAAQALNTGNEPLFKIVGGREIRVTSDNCPQASSGNLLIPEFNAAISACTDHQRQVALDNLLSRSLLALLGLAVLALWFVPDWAGSGSLTRSSERARVLEGRQPPGYGVQTKSHNAVAAAVAGVAVSLLTQEADEAAQRRAGEAMRKLANRLSERLGASRKA